MQGSGHLGPERHSPCRHRSVLALLVACLLGVCVHAQDPIGNLPPLQEDLRDFASATPGLRDDIVRARRHTMVDGFRRLLRVVVNNRMGLPDDPLKGVTEAVVRDFGIRAERLFDIDTYSVDASTVLGLSERALTRRARLQTGFYDAFASLREVTPDDPRSYDQRLSTTFRVIDDMDAFAKRHEDRDLARFSGAVRILLDKWRPDAHTPGGRTAARRNIETFTALLAEHGLETDVRYFIAERDVAQSYLLDGETEKAGAALRSARGCVDLEGVDAALRADLLSLEIEYYKKRSYLLAAQDAAAALAELLPTVESGIPELPDEDIRADRWDQIGQWYVQVAFVRIANGHIEAGHDLLTAGIRKPSLEARTSAEMFVLLAQVQETLGNYREGVRSAQKALTLARDSGLVWQARLHEAACQALRGRVGDARLALEAARGVDKADVAEWDQARLSSRDALVHALVRKSEGDLEGALGACDRALAAVSEDEASVDRVRALWFKSGILLEVGEQDEALDVAFEARAHADNALVNPRWQLFVSELGIADILLSLGRSGEALERLDTALLEGKTMLVKEPALRGEARRLRAESAWRTMAGGPLEPKPTRALLEQLRTAIADLKKQGRGRFGRPRIAAETLRAYELLLEISLSTAGRTSAADVVNDARSYYATLDRPKRASLALAWAEVDASMEAILARAAEADGEEETALHHYQRAAKLESRLRSGLRWRAPDGLSARFEDIHDRMAFLHLEAALKHRSPARVRQALLFLEDMRARSLRTLILAAESRLTAKRRSATEGAGLTKPQPLDRDSLNALLKTDRTLVTYAITGRGCYLIALKGKRAEIHKMTVDRRTLERTAHSFLSNLRGEPNAYKADAVIQFGFELWTQLIRPVSHLLQDSKELVIVPDGVLNGVPFAALVERPVSPPTNSSDFSATPFLCARPGLQSVTVAPSLATLVLLQGRAEPAPERSILLIGDPALTESDLGPLPHARKEIEAIAKLHDDSVSLTGPKASMTRLLEQTPGRFATVHIATHTRSGRMTALLLAPERRGEPSAEVGTSAIMGMDLADTGLVVLSACSTGRGRSSGPEGIIGLPRAFLVAGARRVLASNTEIIDDKTSRLMKLLYSQLRGADVGPSRALFSAQRALLGAPKTSWPGFWAPFFVVGSP